jgi:hypothetical protein
MLCYVGLSIFGLSAIIMASKKLSVKPTEFYSWGIFLQIAESTTLSKFSLDVLALWMPNSIKSYNRSFAIIVRKYDLIMRNVLKLLSQEAVDIGKVHAIVTSLSNSEKASHK